ncbi:alpha/beta hydrolase [Temperatibacter marinus]|uniref:Alpha/beta hydrolase n=1 Tax=Temperatibacter marinus TaxID=1456591 RepID=A0AA52HB42_9PROT|nr:alpha/beta hydrolase [Temperatibacter marinus]WND03380.1 alpha/beta hydrolase [Temperatibacter marinus]
MTTPTYLETAHGTRLAYHKIDGRGPGVIWCGGFMSDMDGGKAIELENYCKTTGRSYVRFDYQGHGHSDGAFADGTIGLWHQDTLAILDQLTQGPQVLVGSSMGGWISLLTLKKRPGRVKGFVGIASAPDFTPRHWAELTQAQQQDVLTKGRVLIPSDYGPDPYVFTKDLFDDGWANRVMNGPIHTDIPVRLIQGTADPDVPWVTALDIAHAITGENVEAILVPEGDHRLSRDVDLKRLVRIVDSVCQEIS